MDAKTAAAIEASIEKWQRNADVTSIEDASISGGDCPLCLIFKFSNKKGLI